MAADSMRGLRRSSRKRKRPSSLYLESLMALLKEKVQRSLRQSSLKKKCTKESSQHTRLSSVERLLETGVLKGLRVYCFSEELEAHVPGVIKGSGFLCGCSQCNYKGEVLSGKMFEEHVGANTKFHTDHIFLTNEISIYEVFEVVKNVPDDDFFVKILKLRMDLKGVKLYEEPPQVPIMSSAGKRTRRKNSDWVTARPIASVKNDLKESSRKSSSFDYEFINKQCIGVKKSEDSNEATCVLDLTNRVIYNESDKEKSSAVSDPLQNTLGASTSRQLKYYTRKYRKVRSIGSTSDPLIGHRSLNFVGDEEHLGSALRKNAKHLLNNTSQQGFAVSTRLKLNRVLQSQKGVLVHCTICKEICATLVNEADPKLTIFCNQCDRAYHVGCLKDQESFKIKDALNGSWFCCTDCTWVHNCLRNICALGEKPMPAPFLKLLKRHHPARSNRHINLNWQLLGGGNTEDQMLLSEALEFIQMAFRPILHGKEDMIRHMIFGNQVAGTGQDFRGMLCIVIKLDDVIVSIAVLRVFGKFIAELPLVTTSKLWQQKGYFRMLLSLIEELLCLLQVRFLVAPVHEKMETIWIHKLGFARAPDQKVQVLKEQHGLILFEDTALLEKQIRATDD